jgi:C4-dicarboxylate-specific signal transduction histidine kinase
VAAGVAGNLRGYVCLLETTAQELGQYTGFPVQQRQVLQEQACLLNVFSGGVALLDRRGTAVAVTPPAEASVGLNYAFRDYFQQVQAN